MIVEEGEISILFNPAHAIREFRNCIGILRRD